MNDNNPINITDDEFRSLQSDYLEDHGNDSVNIIVYGKPKSGKTHILTTARLPLFLYSFDNGGTRIPPMLEGVKNGTIFIKRFETDSIAKPTVYNEWKKDFDKRVASGFFDNIGTLAFDSVGTWSQCLMNQVAYERGRKEGEPALQDYKLARIRVLDKLTIACGLDCDFILTGHIEQYQDDVSGKTETSLNVAGKLKNDIPLTFDDIYMASTKNSPEGLVRELLTRPKGIYMAGSRLGGDTLSLYEPPNIKAILKKVDRLRPDLPGVV